MADNNPIKYSDLISPDDSIEKLIGQLEELNTSYTNMATSIKQQASTLVVSLGKVSGATSQGRKAIKEADEETKRLEKAYKQLDAALSVNAKEIARLNVVKREANNFNKQMVLRGKEEISTLQQIKEASYQQLSAQYSLNKAYINSLTAKDREIQKNRELIQTTKEIYEQMKRLQADTGKMQLNVGNYPNIDTKAILGSIVGVTSAAGAAIAAVNALKNGISVTMEYEHALSGLAAILGTTKDNIGELAEQARDLGATTQYTAKEAVELQTELAKLGYTTQNIIAMAPGVLSFSQATGSSLADAASLTGAALRMFEKDASSTQEFVDKMTAATTKSALSFNYLANAMSTVSPVANAFGFNLEDVLALLGQLANAGFDASSAATATRNILLNLADSSGKLATALGAPVKDLDGLINGLKTLNERGIDLAESLDLTDKRSVAAFNTFLAGTDTVLELRDALNACDGAAAQMAKTMGDDLAGDVKTLQSAWQDLMIEINNGQGILRSAIQLVTQLVRSWKEYLSLPKGKDEILNEAAAKYDDGSYDDNGNIIKPVASQQSSTPEPAKGSGGSSSKNKKSKKGSGGSSSKSAADKALKEQEQQQKRSLELRRQYEDTLLELIDDEQTRERTKIIQHYNRKIEDLQIQIEKEKNLSVDDRKNIDDTIIALEEAKQVKLAELVEMGAKKQRQAQEMSLRQADQQRQQSLRQKEQIISAEYDIQMNEIEMLDTSEKEKTRLRLEAEKDRLQKLLALYEQDGKKLSDAEMQSIKSQISVVDKELERNDKKNNDIYDMLGFNLSDDKKEAITSTFDFAKEQLSSYLDSWVQAADAKAQLAAQDVERAQNVLDAEIEARNQGYANDVETARKELELAKNNQEKALKEKEKAQKAQLALQTIEQASNLVTASALIWSQLGFPWAIPAIAVMWGSFAAAKIKAMEVTSEQYGQGTVELLQGGSHQSGNDVDLGRKRDGTRRRAEGGEFFAVINKRNSRKYRKVIPDIINAFNTGTFEQKYANAYAGADNLAFSVQGVKYKQLINLQNSINPDLRRLGADVRAIREQGDRNTYTDERGTHVVYKNLHRIIKS